MSAGCYVEAIDRVLRSEGGYVNHPADPGGPTNFGVTIADYRRYVKSDATVADMRAMKVDAAQAIYRTKYWAVMRGDALPAGVDYCVFDYAVNSGTGRAPKVLQRVLGVAVTGRMDDATVAAARAHDPRTLVQAICDERLRFLKGLKTWAVFGAGWSRRVAEVRAAAHAMVSREEGVPVRTDAPVTPAPGKGAVPLNDAARRGAAGGAVATGGAAAQQAAASGADWIVVALIVVATIAVAAGAFAFWRWRQKHRQEAPA